MNRAIWLVWVTLSAVCPVFALGGSTCEQATVVNALPYIDEGQLESGIDPNCPGDPSNDLFYVFTAPYASTFRFDMCGSGDCCIHLMRVWTGGTCCSGAAVTVSDGCGDDAPQYILAMTSGQVVYIEVGKAGGEWAIAPNYRFTVSDMYPPAGGTCAAATGVGTLPYTRGGQLESGYDPNCSGEPVNDKFYVFTAPQAGTFRFDMCGSGDCCIHMMRLWTGGTCCSGAAVTVSDGCGDDAPQYDLTMTAGQVVYIEVGKVGFEWATAPYYVFNVSLAGDACPGTEIPALPYTDSGSTLLGSHQFNGSCYGGESPDVVYNFSSPDSVLVRATVLASWHEALQVRKNNCETGASLQCDVGIGPDSSWFDFWTEPDSTYYFIVDGDDNSATGYTFTLRSLSCPTPDSLIIRSSGNDAILRWPHVECDTPLYSIYRNDSLDVQAIPANLIGTTTDSTFTDAGVLSSGDLKNFYIVTAE